MARTFAGVDRPLPSASWAAGLVAVGASALVVVHLVSLTRIDDVQQLSLVRSLASGDLAHAFGGLQGQVQTSGPGFGLYATPIFVLLRIVLSEHRAYVAASLTTLVPLAWAGIAASRATGVARRSPRELATVATLVMGTPVLANFVEALHPADVLATAACLGAFAAVSRRHTTAAFVLLGFALATRQWAVVAVPVLAVLLRGDERRHLVIGSLGVAVVLVLPFLVADPGQTLFVLEARGMSRGPLTALSMAELPDDLAYALSRYLPLVATVVLCAWLLRRRVRWSPDVAVAALAVAFSVRPLVDPGGYLYYAAPAYACFVLLGPRTWRWLVAAAVGSSALLARFVLRERFPYAESVSPFGVEGPFHAPGMVLSIATTVAFAAALVAVIVHLRRVVLDAAPSAAAGSGQGAAGGPGGAEAGDSVLG